MTGDRFPGAIELAGRVAVVTGAANGIGLGLSRRFLQEGMAVVMADVNEKDLAAAAAELAALGEVLTVPTDVGDADSVDALAAATADRFGRVDVLCNNAGVGGYQRFETVDVAAWRWYIDVNLLGVVNGIRSFLPLLDQQSWAHIVNTSSVGGFLHSKYLTPYTATRAAVVALTEALRAEFAEEHPTIHLSLLAPGSVETQISRSDRNAPTGVRRLQEADPDLEEVRQRKAASKVGAMQPAEVADLVVRGILNGSPYIFTHPEHAIRFRARAQAISEAWDAGPVSTQQPQADDIDGNRQHADAERSLR